MNSAHSNVQDGLKITDKINPQNSDPCSNSDRLEAVISNFISYRNNARGIFIKEAGLLKIINCTLADNIYANLEVERVDPEFDIG